MTTGLPPLARLGLTSFLLLALVDPTPFIAATPAAAQTSVEEAMRVVDQYRGAGGDAGGEAAAALGFVPPPRTIADITAILDQQKPDPAKRAAAEAAADRRPAPGLEGRALARFLVERGLAAAEIGRAQQRAADIKRAVEVARQAGMNEELGYIYLTHAGHALQSVGDTAGALDMYEQRIRLLVGEGARSKRKGLLFGAYQNKILLAARTGRLDLARATLAESERLFAESADWFGRNDGSASLRRANWRMQILRSRAAIAQETGSYEAAERDARAALALAESTMIPNEALLGVPPGFWVAMGDSLRGDIARALMRQGRLVEAEAEVRRALLGRLKLQGRYAAETASNVGLLSAVLFQQGRYDEAGRLAAAACEILEQLGHGAGSRGIASARRNLAQAQSAAGRDAEAQATYAQLERDVGDDALLRRNLIDHNMQYALSLLRAGRAADADRILRAVLARNLKNLGDKNFLTAEARGWLGVALARAGQKDAALDAFAKSMPVLLAVSRQSDDNSEDGASVAERDRAMQRIVEAYIGLLADTRGTEAAAETFRLADAVRGRSVERALAASAVRSAIRDPKLADLARHEQDAQKLIAGRQGLLTEMLSQAGGNSDPQALTALRTEIDQLRTARARLREEIERRFPDYANLIDPRAVPLEAAQKVLRPGEALIATYVGEERLFVWAVPRQGPPAFAAAPVAARDVAGMVAGLRKALDPRTATVERLPQFDVALAHKLYGLLLAPVAPGWQDARSLLFVPHRALGELPLALLVTEDIKQPARQAMPFAEYKPVPFLVRKAAVTQLPSVASLLALRNLPPPAENRRMFIGFGDPAFGPEKAPAEPEPVSRRSAGAEAAKNGSGPAAQRTKAAPAATAQLASRAIPLARRARVDTGDKASADLAVLPRLPDTADELRDIALALNADPVNDVLLGAAANERAVKTMNLADRRIVVFATHGLVPGDLDGLMQPALALSAPSMAGVDGDGLLTMEEVLGLKLDADWVVLSACNTASGAGAGAEAVSGLGRAFFYAGTRALLVSNWPVETTAARALTAGLFRRQGANPALPRGEALRQAELALIDGPGLLDPQTKQPLFSYAHPLFWAPFTVVGDGGAGIRSR
ncbi:MAG: CHAT domain-containing protein [Alphaproteobacteria bacterium]|nr:CHAT domain-containing protein [Alphaproteobacteria bacterium]